MAEELGGAVDGDDADLLRRFVDFVALSKVEERVRGFLGKQGDAELRSAFGHAGKALDPIEEDWIEDWVTKDQARDLSEKVEQLLTMQEWKAAVIKPQVVKDEAEHARTELVRHWLDTLLLAFEIGQLRAALPVTWNFEPKASLERNDAEWRDALLESRAALLSNVALSGDDVTELETEYFEALSRHAAKGPVLIPGSFEFVLVDNGAPTLMLRRKDGDAA